MLIYKGAEADLNKIHYLGFSAVEKRRKKKKYRIKQIDERIRKQRTKQEASMMIKARKKTNTPFIFSIDLEKKSITMEYIEGKKAKDFFNEKSNAKIMEKIAEQIRKMHDENIIHGDLTTSNIIIKEKEPFFIDFGLSYTSGKTEDKAVDLLNLKKMMKATHFKNFEHLWKAFEKGYKDSEIFKKIKEIEARARYS